VSRYRLYPTREQEQQLTLYCGHARYVWNLAVEQLGYSDGRQGRWCPGFAEQSRQLTEARRANPWMRDTPTVVGQQALRDFNQAVTNWHGGTHRRPTWRKQGRNEGFRVTDGHGIQVEQLNRKWSRAWVPRLGWVKFRRTRALDEAKSFRITRDGAGRWHIAFAVIPEPIVGPCDGSVVGIDRGVTITLALSDGAMQQVPDPSPIKHAARALSRCKRGSNRRKKAKSRLARLHARKADRRKDWAEKASTDIARRYDTIRIEDLKVRNMVRSAKGTIAEPGRNVRQKAGLNRSILNAGWTLFATRLEQKAAGRVEKVNPAFTSQRCSSCGHVDSNSRKSQALFECTACAYVSNADLNAAKNIAAGRAARGAEKSSALKRVPQHVASPAA
jgi:IS605 OrfB family transposase